MKCNCVMAILIDKRTGSAVKVQELLTRYGCIISVRLGLHETKNCAEEGMIILSLFGEKKEIEKLENQLNMLERVKAKTMELTFDD
ncbi:MAG: hypothetical protein KGZ94_04260 [Clostridia bacterium]|nr:hypothetical protein [Clostridia bacterium]